jgi:hypothetical protein
VFFSIIITASITSRVVQDNENDENDNEDGADNDDDIDDDGNDACQVSPFIDRTNYGAGVVVVRANAIGII